jgi:hypothetical protein
MAILVSPTGLTFTTATAPENIMEIVVQEDLMPPDAQPIYTRQVLSSPALDQLANLSAGYAL